MQAILLAGGKQNGEYKALQQLGEKTMLDYVLAALQKTKQIDRIILVGDRPRMARWQSGSVVVADGAENLIDSFLTGVQLLTQWDTFLVVTADIPLLTEAALQDFLQACSHDYEVHYPIVSQQSIEAKFGKVERTYVRLKDGFFTGGNVLAIHPAALEKCLPLAAAMTKVRKSPFKLAKLLGWRILWQLLIGRLSPQTVCSRLHELTGVRAHCVRSAYAEIGMDVDKPADEAAMRKFFEL